MSQSVQNGKRVEQFIPPEGVPITFAIGSIGSRLGAQILDIIFTAILIFTCGFVIAFTGILPSNVEAMLIILLGFLVRTPYYILSELIWNGRTLGKKITGIRVINASGRRLTPHQVTARNLMKEVEIFGPMSLLASIEYQSAWENGLAGAWLLVVVIVPLANRRRQRLGDIIAGTLVIDNPRSVLLSDLALTPASASSQAAFDFQPEHLDVYGKYELQTLEDVLRDSTKTSNHKEIEQIVRTITRRIRYEDSVKSGQELLFLNDFYRAQREHLESLKLFGTLRENKYHEDTRTETRRLI
ncbi:RDD family protein [Rhizobium hidalgonense]|uniref:RDD family protein n=1 Tax=Rhizobium hidalgonense TaxID=1538159 RepID=A0A2A6KET4_9HYPH|nr:RDD family protein [Rhizobium hidalgonense]MDR9772821.1 RDD family protein [Rhizobium hidalgonense]MDR9812942.1 RDD family protein [Rhizobium hidalgonense]MDR9820281.1 RDD family protein [Rhizobium hidalgonense]PDT23048.1 RDD family protein [Rhizobium hidalgonense]PON01291.1 transporter [Rhizobium hidalgonense]